MHFKTSQEFDCSKMFYSRILRDRKIQDETRQDCISCLVLVEKSRQEISRPIPKLISMTIALIEKFTVEIRSQDLVEIMEEQVPIEFDELSGIFPKLSFYQASLKDQMEELKIINDGVKEYLEELYIEMMNKKLI